MEMEWQAKTPYCFEVGDGGLFAFAGLWDRWADPDGMVVQTCTILTTTPNTLLRGVHDRVPVILNPHDYASCFGPSTPDSKAILKLLVPYDGHMRRYAVSTRINQVQNDDACTKRSN
jgi:putative SOS response-associated peptidase YedK